MDAPVKPRRRYDSSRRREQATQTRAAILDAAERLFTDHGYAATSVPAIAKEAGVGLKTVYVAFSTKSGVLHQLWNVRLGGDDEPIPVIERPWFRSLLAEDDAARLVRTTARQSRITKQRAGAVMRIVRHAADIEPAIADLWHRIETEFRSVLGASIRRLAELDALSLDVETAIDIIWTLNHPDTWYLLVERCGWTPEQYERWLGETLCSQLLRTDSNE